MVEICGKILQKVRNNKLLVTNFSYLSILQAFTLISPLITYPYLIRTIGLELNGVVVFGQSISTYMALIINFGFNISGVRQIAINKADKNRLNEIISVIYTNKFIIWLMLLMGWLVLISHISFFQEHYWVYFWSFFITINELLFPVWLFQGLEKMKYTTLINISVRLLFIVLVFFVVKKQTDYYRVSFLYALGAFVAGLISTWMVFSYLRYRYRKPTFLSMKRAVLEGFPLFISSISIQIYANINKLLVGGFLGMSEVSIYDFSEKIIAVARIPMGIIQQTIFPKISRERNVAFVNKMLKYVSVLNMVICVMVLLLMPLAMDYMLGKVYEEGMLVTLIMACSLIVSGVNLFLGGCRLIPWGYSKVYSKTAVLNSFFFILFAALMYGLGYISLYTIATLSLLTELFGLVILYIQNKHLRLLCNGKANV